MALVNLKGVLLKYMDIIKKYYNTVFGMHLDVYNLAYFSKIPTIPYKRTCMILCIYIIYLKEFSLPSFNCQNSR